MNFSGLNAANIFVHISPINFTEDFLRLLEEAKAHVLFGKEMEKLEKFPKAMWKLKTTHSVPSVRSLLSTAGDMFEKYPDIQNSIVCQALWATVCEKNAEKTQLLILS